MIVCELYFCIGTRHLRNAHANSIRCIASSKVCKKSQQKYKKISIYANFIAIKMFFCKKIFNNLQKRDFFRIFVGGFCEKYSSLVRIAIVT